MKIKNIIINNFRNLDKLEINFDMESNYIVGENNLGKSNLLDALYTTFSNRKFEEDDYGDLSRNIEIIIKLILNDAEIGFFGDEFNPRDKSSITLRYFQSPDDAYPNLICENTGDSIPTHYIKQVHFMKYQSTESPNKELRFTSKSSAGNIFGSIVDAYINRDVVNNTFLNISNVENLTKYINERLGKLKGFSQYDIKAMVANNVTELLSNLFYLSDGKHRIDKTGCGVQFIAMATLNIIGQIMELYKKRGQNFSEQLYTDSNGQKILPIIVALDEPEVHLHPYLQRALISYYKSILCNKDLEFLELLKMMFEIDGLDGQLLVVTHSSEILLDDFKNIIRFYQKGDKTGVISGSSLINSFHGAAKKQLIMRFKDIRETFFSHAVVIVEGETEYGCLPYFAESLGINLDDKCISIVMAKGEKSIKPLRNLFSYFKIPSVIIYDGDVRDQHEQEIDDVYFTSGKCLEDDIVDSLYVRGELDTIKKIAFEIDDNVNNCLFDLKYVKKWFEYLEKNMDDYVPKKLTDVEDDDQAEFCVLYKIWYLRHKGILTGRIIGSNTPADSIPWCYVEALKRASELV
ncbi:ATP-dependent endonuclease [uncultured Megasphaera sp.]|uniref:ATP-dependent nuclease n=1 Tax=uncultured Megasphaera sp. TaxID=165188 RepID=UPI0025CF8E7F|nr:AAA family ATPase [uncultured Megasphaera sp.]